MLSKRERYIGIATGAAVALLALDYLVLTPVLESRDRLATQRQTLERQKEEARQTLASNRNATQRWKDFRAAGLGNDASSTESGLLNALGAWSRETDLPLLSVRPDRASGSRGLRELTFQASTDGSMRAIRDFLNRVETARLPVRIRELQIASRTEGTDDLSLQLRLSTIWDDPQAADAELARLRGKGKP